MDESGRDGESSKSQPLLRGVPATEARRGCYRPRECAARHSARQTHFAKLQGIATSVHAIVSIR